MQNTKGQQPASSAAPSGSAASGWANDASEVRSALAAGERVVCRQIGGITWMDASINPTYQNFELFEYWIGEGNPLQPGSRQPPHHPRVVCHVCGHNDTPAPSAETAGSLLLGLIALGNRESVDGNWRVTLDYDNYQDGARVLDGDGNVLGECYDLNDALLPDHPEKHCEWQYLVAIQRAIDAANIQATSSGSRSSSSS